MAATPVWIASVGAAPPAGATPVWIASRGGPPAGPTVNATEVSIVGYGGVTANLGATASPVWIAAYGGPPPAGATPIWISGG